VSPFLFVVCLFGVSHASISLHSTRTLSSLVTSTKTFLFLPPLQVPTDPELLSLTP
jgi:hypothetical protein